MVGNLFEASGAPSSRDLENCIAGPGRKKFFAGAVSFFASCAIASFCFKDFFYLFRDRFQRLDNLPPAIERQHADAAHQQGQQCQHRHCDVNALVGCHADFRPGMGDRSTPSASRAIVLPTTLQMASTFVPAPPRLAQACQRVSRFRRIVRDRQNERVFLNRRVAITEFTRVFPPPRR